MPAQLTLVIGGIASGKSAFAEGLVRQSGQPRVYLATAQASDVEMAAKITRHRDTRGPGWHTIEEPLAVAARLRGMAPGQCVLFDCATLWLSNHLLAGSDLEAEIETLLGALAECPSDVIVVSNEVGLSGVPANALARRFANVQGRLNQAIAARAARVVLVVAGLPVALKGPAA